MYLIDACIRFPAMTLLCLIAVLARYASAQSIQARLTSYFCISLVTLLVYSLPDFYGIPPLLLGISWLFQSPIIILAWLLGLSIFIENFALTKRQGGVLVLHYLLAGIAALTNVYDLPVMASIALSLSLILEGILLLHLGWVCLQSPVWTTAFGATLYKPILVWMIIPVMYFVLNAEAVLAFLPGLIHDPNGVSFARAIFLFGLSIPVIFALSKYELQDLLLGATLQTQSTARSQPNLTNSEIQVHLKSFLEREKVYLQPQLTLHTLSHYLNVPEHNLRHIILNELRFQSFANFLNTYRLDHAKQALSDPTQDKRPLAQIAKASGFKSLSAFKRIFRASVQETPSEFRTRFRASAGTEN